LLPCCHRNHGISAPWVRIAARDQSGQIPTQIQTFFQPWQARQGRVPSLSQCHLVVRRHTHWQVPLWQLPALLLSAADALPPCSCQSELAMRPKRAFSLPLRAPWRHTVQRAVEAPAGAIRRPRELGPARYSTAVEGRYWPEAPAETAPSSLGSRGSDARRVPPHFQLTSGPLFCRSMEIKLSDKVRDS